jgi:hypothetical protein
MRIAMMGSLMALAALGCGGDDSRSGEPTGSGAGGAGGDGPTLTGGGDDTSLATGTGGGVGGGVPGCSEAAQLVYVLSDANEMYSFSPDLKEFKRIGTLGCRTSQQPNSMAVDRDANAWVNYVESSGFGDSAGSVFKVSTTDASCEPTSISLTDGWFRLGMGFATDSAGVTSERLFVAGTGNGGEQSVGLGKIDPAATAVAPVGDFTGALRGANAELTGTGDGRLYGFFTTTPVQVAEIEKETGRIISAQALQGVEAPSYWAFSFWGGDFYLYTAPDASLFPQRTSNVTRYRPSDGSIDTSYMTNIGFRIVGAGVSTCAPLESPR